MMFDVIPVGRKILKEGERCYSFALQRGRSAGEVHTRARVVKIDILAKDRKRFDSADLPNLRIGRSQKVAIE
ncbi:MAG TPA: hypothetical protein VFS81_07055 [Candidatus Binatia bacterium]|nr:hypothetical protein [Candidatus Binatia bacterium]